MSLIPNEYNDLTSHQNCTSTLLNELIDSLKLIENCASCKELKRKNYFDFFYKSLSKLKKFSDKLEKEKDHRPDVHTIWELEKKIIELAEAKRQEIINSEKYLDPDINTLYNSLNESFNIIMPNGYSDTHLTKKKIIELAEAKRQEIINSEKYLSDTKNYKHHPESVYTSHLLNVSIKQAGTSYISSTELVQHGRVKMTNKRNCNKTKTGHKVPPTPTPAKKKIDRSSSPSGSPTVFCSYSTPKLTVNTSMEMMDTKSISSDNTISPQAIILTSTTQNPFHNVTSNVTLNVAHAAPNVALNLDTNTDDLITNANTNNTDEQDSSDIDIVMDNQDQKLKKHMQKQLHQKIKIDQQITRYSSLLINHPSQ
nr:648_t:CDS:2 [Entrophospora candida]